MPLTFPKIIKFQKKRKKRRSENTRVLFEIYPNFFYEKETDNIYVAKSEHR